MVDALNIEERLTMKEAAKVAGKSLSTIYKWISASDYRGRPKVFLETTLFGGELYTNREALRAFAQHGPRRVYRRQRPNVSVSASADKYEAAAFKRLREHGVNV